MAMKYTDYYRHYGIRRAMQMVAPTLIPTQKLTLPRESVLHYLPDGNSVGIAPDDYLLHEWSGPIYAEHVLELVEERGSPRHTAVQLNKIIRDYHRKYRRIRQLHDLPRALGDPRTLVVENYAILPDLYRYAANLYRSYNKWWNIQATFWAKVNEIAKLSERPQFVRCQLPTVLPSPSILIKGSQQLTTKTLSLFPEQASLFILELWKWLGEARHESTMGKLDTAALDKINLIWVESGQWFVINLGLVERWRQPSKTEVKDGAARKEYGLEAAVLQRRFLRLLMFLHEARTTGGESQGLIGGTEESEDSTHSVEPAPVTIEVPLGDDESEELTLEPGLDFDKLPMDPVEETAENNAKIDAVVAKDLEALDHLHIERELALDEELEIETPALPDSENLPMLDIPALQDISLEKGVMAKAGQLADLGMVSAAEYRRFEALSVAYKKLPNPYDDKGLLVDALKIHPHELAVEPVKLAPNIPGVIDKSMLHSTLADYDKKYINHVLKKDVLNAVMNVQKAGVAVTGYRVTEHRDAMSHQEEHHVQLTPVRGKVSTFSFRIPKVNEEGVFIDNGVKYRLAKQRTDLPIRKVNPSTVQLSSYYSKVFVSRSEKKVANYASWLVNQIRVRGMDTANDEVTEMMLGNVYDPNDKVPRIYSTLGMSFRSFTLGEARLFFDYRVRDSMLDAQTVRRVETRGMVFAGTYGSAKTPLVIGSDNVVYKAVELKGETHYEVLGSIEELAKLDTSKAPKEIAEIKIFGKLVPVGLFLAYHLGFRGMLSALGISWIRSVQQGERLALTGDEYAITFEDVRYVFEKSADKAGLILQGLAAINEALVNWPAHLYEKKSVYYNVMDRLGLGVRYVREMDLLVDLFIDPITKELLEQMGEPTTFVGLVLRSCELLLTDWSRDETDLEDSRIRGYERFAGAVYQELVKAIRVQRARGVPNAPIDISPYAVRTAIMQDSANRLVEESNPVHELKGQEEVTFSGTGGRSSRSMVGSTRIFHEGDLGKISESTKDSSDVAITTFMTANPLLTSVRGLTDRFKEGETGASSLISTSALLAPAADRDDPKRVNFIAIQNSSTTYSTNQRANPLRTGYERVIAHRVSDLYAAAAQQDGEVTKVTPRALEVTYKDGSVKTVELGRRFGNVAGLTIPHELVTSLKVGDKVKHGDVMVHNKHFFEVDPLNKSQVLWKQGVLLNTALLECPETLEDSSALSLRAAKLLDTHITKVRDVVVKFDETVHDVLEEGQQVDVDSILCTIEDPITATNRLFDESSLDTLKMLATNAAKAKAAGTIERVEVFYNGDLDDLSPTLQDLASESDANRKRRARELREPYTSGQVPDSMRIGGNPLLPGQAVIRFYITTEVPAGVGDKGVFANQMKTIFGRIFVGTYETEDGTPIDAEFSYQSIDARIVQSPQLIGTTNTLLQVLGRLAVAAYDGK